MHPLGATISVSLVAAVLFAFGNHCAKRALADTDSATVTLYQIGTVTLLYWLASPLFMQAEYWVSGALSMLILVGLFRPLISSNLGTAGTRILGPTVSSTMSATGPLVGVTLGVLLLGESLSWQGVVGTIGIVSAVATLSWRGNANRAWPAIALLLPFAAAMVRASSHAVAKIGLESIPSPLFVALVTYSVSFPLALLYDRVRGHTIDHRALPRRCLGWMVLSGALYAGAVMSLNTALLNGDLVVVSPILACTPFFTLLLGLLVFNEANLDRRTIFAVSLVVPSVALIALSS